MYMCMLHMHIHVHISISMYVYVHVDVSAQNFFIYIYVYVYINAYTCRQRRMYSIMYEVHTHKFMCACMCTRWSCVFGPNLSSMAVEASPANSEGSEQKQGAANLATPQP